MSLFTCTLLCCSFNFNIKWSLKIPIYLPSNFLLYSKRKREKSLPFFRLINWKKMGGKNGGRKEKMKFVEKIIHNAKNASQKLGFTALNWNYLNSLHIPYFNPSFTVESKLCFILERTTHYNIISGWNLYCG